MDKQNSIQNIHQHTSRTIFLPILVLVLAFTLLPRGIGNSLGYAKTAQSAQSNKSAQAAQTTQTSVKHIWIVTNEIKVPAKQGKPEIEVYRWDPGTIVLHQGEHVMLHIYGVKGKSHPFELEGYPVKGVAIQGQVTKILFTADKVGTFPLVCLTHMDTAHNGPMIAYVEILPKL